MDSVMQKPIYKSLINALKMLQTVHNLNFL